MPRTKRRTRRRRDALAAGHGDRVSTVSAGKIAQALPHRYTSSVTTPDPKPVTIDVDERTRVSGLLLAPPGSKACFVVAHGAGAGMRHPFMASVANDLAALQIATLRYQFPYMEKGSRRPDTPAVCHAAVRAAVEAAAVLVPSLPLVAGGKSFGGRMTSQAQAGEPLPRVRGLIFLGFPLHPPKEPSNKRGEHLSQVKIPMLFVQGARDDFAELPLLNPLLKGLGSRTTLCLLPDADHSFKVPARSPLSSTQIHQEMLQAIETWIDSVIA